VGARGGLRFEPTVEMGYVSLECGQGPGWWLVVPKAIDDPVVAEPPVAVEHEHRQDGAFLRAAEVDRDAVV
jgi:hypothetical protein